MFHLHCAHTIPSPPACPAPIPVGIFLSSVGLGCFLAQIYQVTLMTKWHQGFEEGGLNWGDLQGNHLYNWKTRDVGILELNMCWRWGFLAGVKSVFCGLLRRAGQVALDPLCPGWFSLSLPALSCPGVMSPGAAPKHPSSWNHHPACRG